VTNLYGLEALFLGTAVVYPPADLTGSRRNINQSVEPEAHILLIWLILVHKCSGMTERYVEHGTRADPVHCRATSQTAV